MWVRNFVDEFPGPIHKIHATRLYRVRQVIRDIQAGRRVPDLLIQPTLALTVLPGKAGAFYISPDFLVFDREINMYRVGELKSFIMRDRSSLDPQDLDNTRRQSAVGILALRDEAAGVGLIVPDDLAALFVFATPFGLKPADPHQEMLLGELEQVKRGIASMQAAAERLAGLRDETHTSLANLAEDLRTNYRESCVGSCLLAKRCESLDIMSPARLGDRAAHVLGEIRLDALVPLLRADPTTLADAQLELRHKAEAAARVIGVTFDELVGMIA
jgi:hypothetical protein